MASGLSGIARSRMPDAWRRPFKRKQTGNDRLKSSLVHRGVLSHQASSRSTDLRPPRSPHRSAVCAKREVYGLSQGPIKDRYLASAPLPLCGERAWTSRGRRGTLWDGPAHSRQTSPQRSGADRRVGRRAWAEQGRAVRRPVGPEGSKMCTPYVYFCRGENARRPMMPAIEPPGGIGRWPRISTWS